MRKEAAGLGKKNKLRGAGRNAIENWFENTFDPKKNGIAEAFSEENLGLIFDPKKNGVTAAFEKFGANTQAAFKDLGEKMARAFDPNQNGVAAAMNDFGKKLGVALSDPDTWIFIIGTVASIAALVLSGGTAGPLVVAALGALGPTMNIINNVAQGRPVDPFDIAAMAFAIIPGVGALTGGMDDAVRAGVGATKALGPAAKAAALGETLARATAITNRVSNVALRTGLLAKLKTASDLAKTITNVGNKMRVVMKNPGSIKTLLFGQRGWKAIGPVLTNTEKAQALAAYGLTAIKAGVQIAKIGEGQGLWQIPDINVPLESIDWENPPEDLQYVLELEVGEDEKKRLEFEKAKREAELRRLEAERIFQENAMKEARQEVFRMNEEERRQYEEAQQREEAAIVAERQGVIDEERRARELQAEESAMAKSRREAAAARKEALLRQRTQLQQQEELESQVQPLTQPTRTRDSGDAAIKARSAAYDELERQMTDVWQQVSQPQMVGFTGEMGIDPEAQQIMNGTLDQYSSDENLKAMLRDNHPEWFQVTGGRRRVRKQKSRR